MTKLHILPTGLTPEILLDPTGSIRIKGRSVSVIKVQEIDEIGRWIDEYLSNPASMTEIVFAFEYINSFGISFLVNILKKINAGNLDTGRLKINWYYESDDEDTLENGKYISSIAGLQFSFNEVLNIKDI